MKKLLFIALSAVTLQTSAQYFQRYYNLSTTPAPSSYRSEGFASGIATRVNFNLTSINPYYTGVGVSFNDNPALLFPDNVADRGRLVRVPKTGTANQNFGYEFGVTPAQVFNTGFRSLAEINNGTGTGGYYICGQVTDNPVTSALTATGGDALFARVNNGATVIATCAFKLDLGGADVATCIRLSTFVPNTYIACGFSKMPQTSAGTIPHTDCWVARVRPNGIVLWATRYNFDPTATPPFSADCIAKSLVEQPGTGNIYVVGSMRDMGAPSGANGLFFSVTAAGANICQNSYDIGTADNFESIKATSDGNFVVGGFTNGASGTGGYNMWINKFTPACGLIWTNVLQASVNGGFLIESKCYDIIERINTSGLAEYYLAGPSYPSATFTTTHVFKADALGMGVDNWMYQACSFTSAFGIDYNDNTATYPGPVVFSNLGGSTAVTGGFTSSFLLKTYFNGCTCTNNCTSNFFLNYAVTPVVNALPAVAIPGFVKTNLIATRFNYNRASLCNQVAVAGGINLRLGDEDLSDISVYPSPATDVLNIDLPESENTKATVTVYDVLGSVVLTNTIATDESNQLSVRNFKAGLYFIVVQNDERTYKTKFLKQ